MSAEIRDKRNNNLVAVGQLELADHFMSGGYVYVVHNTESLNISAINIATGYLHMFKSTDLVQQVHVVIEVHLV